MLVFGGSRGARHLNSAIVSLHSAVLADPRVHVVHVTGAGEFDAVNAALAAAGADGTRWHAIAYLNGMGDALAASDLVVARAGATSIAEITALGLPAVLVPYPYATDDHQTKNAATMVAHGAAELIPDSELDGERFGAVVLELLSDDARRANMSAASRGLGRPDAAQHVAALARRAGAPSGAPSTNKTSEADRG
jgi:UDP-N-acetylglucosamine--N-acetylmuramyl-(pentapeptide) pyrophosphoryl-undecaprenol N-acetylglucosamine transferase